MTGSSNKKVLLVFGTRPEAIKMAPVYQALKRASGVDVRAAVTGQHREMLDQVLNLFSITPDYDLNVMRTGQSLTDITTTILKRLAPVLEDFAPHLLMVHGDTTTTMSAAIAAYYQRIPLAHVEAGLRTGNIYSPWPEEVNRKVTSTIARLHFAPTPRAASNLLAEGIAKECVSITGNTVIDALLSTVSKLDGDAAQCKALDSQFRVNTAKHLILVTGHRRENFGGGFDRICSALQRIAARDDVMIIYPVHLNPNVLSPVQSHLGNLERVQLIPPQDYLPFVHLMRRSKLILTDSGGVQEEAPSLGKPVLVLRDTTERPEAVESGTVRLVGTNVATIVNETMQLLDDESAYQAIAHARNPYGDGLASTRICNLVKQYLASVP